MKRTLSLILALTFILSTLCLVSASAGIETWYVKTGNGKTLNVRHIETGEVIGKLPYGTQVGVERFDSTWAYIVYGGEYSSAKVKKNYLVNYKPSPYVGPVDEKGNVLEDSTLGSETVEGLNKQYSAMRYVDSYTVTVVPDTRTGTARLRWAPSKNSTLVSLLPAGYSLTVLAANSNWLMVEDPTTMKIGYIAAKYTAR